MSKVKIELNSEGIRELLLSQNVADCIRGIANKKASICGFGYEADTYVTPSRVVSSFYPATKAAARDNFKNNTLLKAVGR